MDAPTDLATFTDRYLAVWNEPDPALRRQAVAGLWAEDGVEFTESAEHRGHEAIEARVAHAYDEFVAAGGFAFVPAGPATHHHDAITFTGQMVPAAGGEPVWTGVMFVLLDDDGRILRDYQFTG
jgi:hypothetical protein